MSFADVVIVGSGFGGAVMAARLGTYVARALPARRVVVIDKGPDPRGELDPESKGPPLNSEGNRFRQTLDPQYLSEFGELFTDPEGAFRPGTPSMNVIAGKGLGGGSNLYYGVSLRAPREVFSQVRGGRRLWPASYSRQSLERHYEQVERMLRVRRVEWTRGFFGSAPHWQLATKRDFVFAEACRRIGATAAPLKLAIDRDANDGWWAQGQRFEGRQDLTKNYLRVAKAAGVEFLSCAEADEIAPTETGYVVFGTDRRGERDRPFELECTLLIVAAGGVASSALLLRSRDAFGDARALDVSGAHLGRNLSANGDYGVTGVVGPRFEWAVEGFKGKPMSSFCPSYWPTHKFIVIPFYAAPLYLALEQFSSILPADRPDAVGRASTTVARNADGAPVPHWGLAYKDRWRQFGPRMLTMGCLTLDECEGEVRLAPDGRTPSVVWPQTHPNTEARWSAAADVMRRMYEALGGEMFLDAYRRHGTVSTAHPLGGARMSDDAAHGIVGDAGESFRNRNLFVVDGAIVPSALGVNPSLTIAAVAESIAERLIEGRGTEPLASRLGG